MSEAARFEAWAIVEIMGHRRFAGRVTEQSIGGASFIRIDVPPTVRKIRAWNGTQFEDREQALPWFSKLFGAAAVYCITPVSEEVARAVAAQIVAEPLQPIDLRDLQRLGLPSGAAVQAEGDSE